MQITNKLIEGVVLNFCQRHLTKYEGKFTIEILDWVNMPLTSEECDAIYAHVENGTAVEFVREWYITQRGYDTGAAAQRVVAKNIQEFFNVNILRKSKYHVDRKVFNAILWYIGQHCEMAMPEDAIIDAAVTYIEENYE